MVRTIRERFRSTPTLEGAGVRLHRVFSQPEVPKFDPFLLLDDFSSVDPEDYRKGFPWHPHRGIETVTYIVSGAVEHQDNLGNRGTILDGEVQWMTAGSGIIHQEMPDPSSAPLVGIQLWVNLPREKKMTTPTYRGISGDAIPVVPCGGGEVRVIAGTFGDVAGPATDLIVDVRYFDVRLSDGECFTYELPAHFTAFVYVLKGRVHIGDDTLVEAEYAALTTRGDVIEVCAASSHAHCIIVAGEPIGEPIAWGGPIVMNTEAEVEQAFWEFRNNEFIR